MCSNCDQNKMVSILNFICVAVNTFKLSIMTHTHWLVVYVTYVIYYHLFSASRETFLNSFMLQIVWSEKATSPQKGETKCTKCKHVFCFLLSFNSSGWFIEYTTLLSSCLHLYTSCTICFFSCFNFWWALLNARSEICCCVFDVFIFCVHPPWMAMLQHQVLERFGSYMNVNKVIQYLCLFSAVLLLFCHF